MKKLLLSTACQLFIILIVNLCSAQTPTPTRVMAWFTVPVTQLTPCQANIFAVSQYNFRGVTPSAYLVETISGNLALMMVKDTPTIIHNLSITAGVTYLTPDPRCVASVLQAIAARKILNTAQAMGETRVANANSSVY